MNKNATSLVKNNTHIQRQRNPTMKFLVWNPLTCFRLQISLKANQSHLPESVIVQYFPTPTDVIVIKLIPSLSSWGKQVSTRKKRADNKQIRINNETKQNRTSYPLPHAFMGDTIRHNIAQLTLTSKAYIPCLLVIIIKWCHIST